MLGEVPRYITERGPLGKAGRGRRDDKRAEVVRDRERAERVERPDKEERGETAHKEIKEEGTPQEIKEEGTRKEIKEERTPRLDKDGNPKKPRWKKEKETRGTTTINKNRMRGGKFYVPPTKRSRHERRDEGDRGWRKPPRR
jgi:hypothetical protein